MDCAAAGTVASKLAINNANLEIMFDSPQFQQKRIPPLGVGRRRAAKGSLTRTQVAHGSGLEFLYGFTYRYVAVADGPPRSAPLSTPKPGQAVWLLKMSAPTAVSGAFREGCSAHLAQS